MVYSVGKFPDLKAGHADKRLAGERLRDFREIYAGASPDVAIGQASRCTSCGVPFCQTGCPLQNNIPDWLGLASRGRLQEAWRLSSETSALPEICGRICPQDRLCEGACTLEQSSWDSVTIGSVERFLGDTAWANGWIEPIRPVRERSASVGIVGSGPAGLAAADRLRTYGYRVTIYDRHDRPGGLLIYGIPSFKLEKEVVERRTRRLQDSGVAFQLNFEAGRDASLADLRAQHDCVLMATGVYQARRLTMPGASGLQVVPGLEYLIASNRVGLGDRVADFRSGRLNAAGKDVIVVGGGDTAMDCVRTAVRQGATSVTCLYRRDRQNMPGSAREVLHAEEEGVRFQWLSDPRAMFGEGDVAGVRAVRMRLSETVGSARRAVQEVAESHFDLRCQMVIEALGFEAEPLAAQLDAPELETSLAGTLKVDPWDKMTNLSGVFAAGDIVRGASLVVWAVRDGQDAAHAIHRWLESRPAPVAREPLLEALA